MRKTITKWMALAMTSAMIVTLVPTQALYAEELDESAAILEEQQEIDVEETEIAEVEETEISEVVEVAETEDLASVEEIENVETTETAETEDILMEEETEVIQDVQEGEVAANPIVLKPETPASINKWEGTCYLSFTCEQEGYYSFYSTGNSDTAASLKSAASGTITTDDDSGENFNFKIEKVYLEKGKKYTLEVVNENYDMEMTAKIYVEAEAYCYKISLDVPAKITSSSVPHYYYFRPEEDGYYKFYSSDSAGTDPKGTLYDETDNQIGFNDDSDTKNQNYEFCIEKMKLDASQEYKLVVEGSKPYMNITTSVHVEFQNDKSEITKLENTAAGIKVTGDCEHFEIYRKEATEKSWTSLGDVKGTVTEVDGKKVYPSYTDTSAVAGKVYLYTIRELGDPNLPAAPMNTAGKEIKRLTAINPTVKNGASGVYIKWAKVAGAEGYYVYRKTGTGSYKRIATIKSGTTASYTDTIAPSGATYTYAVKAYSGNYTGAYTQQSIYYLKTTTPTLTNAASGVSIKWTAVDGASEYRVYRKTGTGSYTTITTTSNLSYIDTSVKTNNGTTYIYAVRPMKGSKSGAIVDKTIVRLTHVVVTPTAGTKSLSLAWTKNAKATGYQIQYGTDSKFAGAKLISVGGASTLKKTITDLTTDSTYYVRVRAYNTVDKVRYVSAWSKTVNAKIK